MPCRVAQGGAGSGGTASSGIASALGCHHSTPGRSSVPAAEHPPADVVPGHIKQSRLTSSSPKVPLAPKLSASTATAVIAACPG